MRYVILLMILFFQSGCLTLSHIQKGKTPIPPPTAIKNATVSFEVEQVNIDANRTIVSRSQSENLNGELKSVLSEFGITTTSEPSSLKIKARLRIKDSGCQILFIDSANCLAALVAGPASIYFIPTAYRAEHEITLSVATGGESPMERVQSTFTTTHIHLFLLPLFPLEIYNVVQADFRKSLYRSMLLEQLVLSSPNPSKILEKD
jgi:hypothetical protein